MSTSPSFSRKPGCPLCSIVALASPNIPSSPPTRSTQPEILWRDDNVTVYREKVNPVSSSGHIIIAFNLHVPSIYRLSSSDLPLLVNIRNIARRLLTSLVLSTSPFTPSQAPSSNSAPLYPPNLQLHIGFITPPFKDNKIPVTDHLHAHAYIGPADILGWWRGIAYGPLAWYAIDDLIAEIRESVSNNRIKSGYDNRPNPPIDQVPSAGAKAGTADGLETSEPPLSSCTGEVVGTTHRNSPNPPSPVLLSTSSPVSELPV